MRFEFLIPRRPVSLQTKNKKNLQAWKSFVQAEAAKTWVGPLSSGVDIHLTLVYLYDTDPVDTDNIIKPIQDALVGLVYDDDLLITDVESHRRPLSGIFDVALCPNLLLYGLTLGQEFVYVKVCYAEALESYL
jgi:hypothetical protein